MQKINVYRKLSNDIIIKEELSLMKNNELWIRSTTIIDNASVINNVIVLKDTVFELYKMLKDRYESKKR